MSDIPGVAESDTPLPPDQASTYLEELGFPLATGTLAQKRVHGGGPPFLKFGRAVRYRPSHLRAWVAENTRVQTCTAETAHAA